MKYLLFLTLLFQAYSMGLAQEMFVDHTFIHNLNIAYKSDSNEPLIVFSNEEQKVLNTSILNHLKNRNELHNGWLFGRNILDENGKVDTLAYFYNGKTSNNTFKNDSVLFQFQIPKIDDNGEQIYDDEGDDVYVVKDFYYPFEKTFYKLNSKDNWEYKNGKFIKTVLISGIDFKTKVNESKHFRMESYFSVNNDSLDYKPFKKDIVYTHYFYPEYYSTFLNNDTIWKNPYSGVIGKGIKANALNNEYEVVKFLKPLFKDIHADELSLFQIDTNQNIQSMRLSSNEIDGLFWIKNVITLDENGEIMFDNEGYEMYIETKDPIFPSDILGIEFHEDWYIGKDNFQLKKKVKGIVLISAVYDHEGKLSGMKKIPAYISFE